MRENVAKRRLAAGEACIGTWLSLDSVLAAEALATCGADWLVIDVEHSPYSWEQVAYMAGMIAHRGGVPLVRVPANTGENVKRALDLGAFGVVVPMVNSVEEARAAVAAAKYPPVGVRSVGGALRAVRFAATQEEYLKRANDEVLVVIQAEHRLHLERATEIARVPGVDAVFIGPNDMAASLGVAPDGPEIEPSFQRVLDACRAAGVAAGIHCFSAAAAQRRLAQGFRFVAVASEAAIMERYVRAEIRAAREGGPVAAEAGGVAD
jgi:4-hydroxy-2-oxoheptanedioate aldolase